MRALETRDVNIIYYDDSMCSRLSGDLCWDKNFFQQSASSFRLFFNSLALFKPFFMYTCRKIIGITLANIIFGIHVSLASFFANCSSRSDDI